jgi:hypothetical protein
LWLCKEDGPIESIGAIFFLTASLLFLAAYIFSSGAGNDLKLFHATRNIFYLFLGILFLICFGEEISWGQRLLNWETPRLFSEINAQGEINIHNLWLFHERKPDGTQKSTLALALNMWKLFCVFWLSFCVVVPIIDKISSKAGIFLKRIGLPVAPLWIGALFLTMVFFFTLPTILLQICPLMCSVG